ncbi:MAG: hypothetical protein Q4F33_06400 [Mycoplasmatota bacterium]|nr:hypothetical protein [Mycoplasmatota bacterium]
MALTTASAYCSMLLFKRLASALLSMKPYSTRSGSVLPVSRKI